ncbi:hypothetical protein DJ568_09455 [Mucilaginibacter hurinus]|uniref:DUF4175 domain-containing protein n=1 Tax=Mucilaginibacter hurinus TaxID=2201324 RepID=A0A367GMM5_9SPHI|nr:DUF4175 family protein [Mucilaginibacter hurinus]RCH54709.1 hypothetical protein DJ568_09455 [Mucilaginibacter hurinus]
MQPKDDYQLLISKINTFIGKYYLNKLLRGLIFFCAGLFSIYLLVNIAEYLGNFNTLLRSVLFYLFVIFSIALIVRLIIPALLGLLKVGRSLTYDEAAQIIGKHFSHVNDKLLNTLQLKRQVLNQPGKHELIAAGIDQKIKELRPVSFPSAIDLKQNIPYLKWALIPIGIICGIALTAPTVLTESTKRIIRHNEYFAPAAPFKFIILNSPLTAVQGDDIPIEVKLEGNHLPSDVYIETYGSTFKLSKKSVSRFQHEFKNMQQDVTFKLTGNGYASATYIIKVSKKPTLISLDVELTYPAYLNKKSERLQNAGDLTLPAGTLVKWLIHTQNTTRLDFKIAGRNQVLNPEKADRFSFTTKVFNSTSYKITTSNSFVNRSTDSSAYQVNIISDEPPAIAVEQKHDSISSKALYFNGRIQDDHGFSALTFYCRVGKPGQQQRLFAKAIKADFTNVQADFFYFWNLKDLRVTPGDRVTYFFEVADNDGVTGPKKTRTPERTLEVPDAKQLDEQLNAGTKAVQEKTESAVKLAAEIERESQKLKRLLLNKNTLSFDEKKQVEQLLQKRLELNELVKNIQEENKKNVYNRQENQQISEEIKEKQKQIADLFNNVLDPETQEMLKKLQTLLEKGEKDQAQDELAKMQMDNKSLKKELDRVLELYKKLAFDQKVEQNISQLNQLAVEQQKLSEQTKQPNADRQDLMQQQQNLSENFKEVKKSLEELQKEDKASGGKMDFNKPEQEEKAVDKQIEESTENLKKNERSKASKAQEQAAKHMQQLASKMQEQQQEGEENENNINAAQLRELLKSLVNSSFTQEKVMQSLRNTSTVDPAYVSLAQQQKDIKDNLKTAEDSLYALSRRIPQIQSTVNKEVTNINDHIVKTLQNMGDRKTPEALNNQQHAMTAMNNLALLLSEALEQLQNMQNKGKAGKGKKKQPSVSQLSQMQQKLNQNMQKAREQMKLQGNQGQGRDGRQNMSEQLAKMARQQQQIRQALEQINRDDNKDGRGGLGNLDKISKEMEQTEREIVNRKISEQTIKRQQEIQTRLLEAEKAEQQREQDNKRESNSGKDIPPGYIKALKDYQQRKTKQTEQIRTVSPAFNLYYKEKIKSYFEQLNGK